MRRTALLIVCLVLPQIGGAQLPVMVPGARIRVESRLRNDVEGTLMAQSQDSLIISAVGANRTVLPSSSVTKIRSSRGKSHGEGAIRGMKIGGTIGGAIALAVWYSVPKDEIQGSEPVAPTLVSFVSSNVLGGALFGAAIGAIVGAEKWSTVYSLPMRISVGRGSAGGPNVGVSLAF